MLFLLQYFIFSTENCEIKNHARNFNKMCITWIRVRFSNLLKSRPAVTCHNPNENVCLVVIIQMMKLFIHFSSSSLQRLFYAFSNEYFAKYISHWTKKPCTKTQKNKLFNLYIQKLYLCYVHTHIFTDFLWFVCKYF